MKLLIILPIFSVVFGCGQSKKQQVNDSFFNTVVNDFSRNSYFILLNVDVPGSASEYLIENDDLFYFFHRKQSWNESDYKKKVVPFLQGEKIKVSNSDLDTYHFLRLKANEQIMQDARQGKEFFIGKYFSKKTIKVNLSDDNRNLIIKTLYNWKVPSKLDDESGYLIIGDVNP
jgi:hypothetical protein